MLFAGPTRPNHTLNLTLTSTTTRPIHRYMEVAGAGNCFDKGSPQAKHFGSRLERLNARLTVLTALTCRNSVNMPWLPYGAAPAVIQSSYDFPPDFLVKLVFLQQRRYRFQCNRAVGTTPYGKRNISRTKPVEASAVYLGRNLTLKSFGNEKKQKKVPGNAQTGDNGNAMFP